VGGVWSVISYKIYSARTNVVLKRNRRCDQTISNQQSAMQMNGCRHIVPLYPYHATTNTNTNLIAFNCVLWSVSGSRQGASCPCGGGSSHLVIPESRVTLHGAATWRIQWHVIPEPRAALQSERISSAIL